MPAEVDAHKNSPPAPAKWAPTKEDQDDLAAIDAAIARIQKITPQDPYRLTIPQDEPRYHHPSHGHANQWRIGVPFGRNEHESLQYLTYHFHEPGNETYVLENSWYEAQPKINGSASNTKPATTGSSTPNGAPKKKMTLDAYKKQKTGGIATPEKDAVKGGDAPSKQPAVKGPVERVKAESEEMLAVIESEEQVPAVKEKFSTKHDMKRKREDEASIRPEKKAEAPSEPPAKKVKSSQEQKPGHGQSQVQDSQKTGEPTKDDERNESGLPPRLSPGMPPKLSPPLPAKLSPLLKGQESKSPNRKDTQENGDEPSLPTRLSPTLPENIEKTLRSRANSSGSAPGSTSKEKHDMLTPVKKGSDGITKRKSPAPRNGFRANSSSPAVRSDAEDRIRPAPAASRAKSPEHSQDDDSKKTTSRSKYPERPSLLVKIKYKKAKKADMQRILKMPSRPDKSMSQPPESQPAEEAEPVAKTVERRNGERKDSAPVKGVAQKIGPVKKDKKPQSQVMERSEKPEKQSEKQQDRKVEKRPLPDDEGTSSPTKRRKPESSEMRKEPSTPAQREVDSPLAPKSGLQATPSARKDLLSQAMRREQSQDSNATHNTPPALSSTPSIGSTQPNGFAKAPSSQPSNKTPKQQAWETEQKRLETLGRELKHSSSAHLNASQSETSGSSNDQKLAAVKAIESFLCYLLAFTCLDEANLAADPRQSPSYTTWRSLHGFYGFVKRNAEAFPVLCGLTCSLGVVYTARILEIAAQFPNDGPSRSSILEFHATLQKAANEAEMKLDVDNLQETFPKCWAQRSKKHTASEKLEPTKLSGGFKLPIGLATTPVRAARAGHAMLQEWLERERIDYTLKLKI